MDVILSILVFLLFCVDYYYMYYNTVNKKKNKILTIRQKAYIMSIKSTITLFLLSLFVTFKYFNNCSFNANDTIVINLGILNLISYFVMDCIIGYHEYHKYLVSLSGYFHHVVYTILSIVCIRLNIILPYILFFIEELPTIILSIGKFNGKLRSDSLFGLTFFMTRIIYHIFLIIITYKYHTLFPIIGILALGLHLFWFKNWINKYTL